MFNVSCIHPPKNATRVNSSIELAQVMKSLESIDDFSYIGLVFLLFPMQNGDGYAFFSSTIFAANACFLIEKCRLCMSFDACESSNLIHSVPFPRLGISGALLVVMSYLVDYKLFR